MPLPPTPPARTVDFSSGGGGSDNPPPAAQPARLHGWLLERLQEGDRINRTDPAWARAANLIADVMGDQPTGEGGYPTPPGAESRKVVLNQIRKAINTHASMLTDVKPLWEWRTQNDQFKSHATRYNDLLVVWWLRTFADLELADGVRYAATIGSSDVVFEWDKNFNGGDMRMSARDWRDTVPIRPEKSASLQDWEGVIFCESHTPAKIRSVFPGSREIIADAGAGGGVGVFTQYRKVTSPEKEVGTLSGLGAKDPSRYSAQHAQPLCIVYRAYLRDRSINLTDRAVRMGPLESNWGYWVAPGKPLYPRGRHVVFTAKGILFDGPNPYWHAKWPLSRLSLQRWPWLMVGMPLAYDLRSLAAMLNITVNDILQVFSQWVHRGSVWGKNAPESQFQRFDSSKPNFKVRQNQLVGTGFQLLDGPQLPPWTMQFLQQLFAKWDEISGVANLSQLIQLRQSPAADTLDKYMQAMTPEIRMEARQIELFMRDIAEMFLYNAAQFYSMERRITILGDAGATLEDKDRDPGTMVPAMAPGTVGYVPQLDSGLPTDERARYYLRQFGFYVAPSSILAIHAQERKMMMLQLSRQGYVDLWTTLETLEVPNVGEPPMMMLPKELTPQEAANLPPDPTTGQPAIPTELRRPRTIIERLQAQRQLGIGQTVSAAGRKASGQEPPQLKARPDGSTTVTES
jgi:hypothetical protein